VTHIEVEDAQSFLEGTKANLSSLDDVLENELSVYVLGRLSDVYSDPATGTTTWIDSTTTPELVKMIIAMEYAGYYYNRQYSEVISDDNGKSYGDMLIMRAETMLAGVISGSILLAEVPTGSPLNEPVFYPTDASSTKEAVFNNTDCNDSSLGPPMFSVGKVF
jgi:hypothetical protein